MKKLNNKKNHFEFIENMSNLLNVNYTLFDSLEILGYNYDLKKIIESLSKGEKLSNILKEYKFDNDVILLIEMSVEYGDLSSGFLKSKELLKRKTKYSELINSSLRYPIIMIIVVFISFLIIKYFLYPQIQNIYIHFQIEIDTWINIISKIFFVMPKIIVILIMIILIIYIYFRSLKPYNKIKFLKVLKIQNYYLNWYNYAFVMQLSNLLQANISLEKSLIILSEQKSNLLLSLEAEKIYNSIASGKKMSESMNPKIYKEDLIQTITIGERQFLLKENLINYVTIIFTMMQNKNNMLISLIQPFVYMFFALIIVLMYIVILMPIYSLMQYI